MDAPKIQIPEIKPPINNPEIPSIVSGAEIKAVDPIVAEIAKNDDPLQAEIVGLSTLEDPSNLDRALNVPKAGDKISDNEFVKLEDAANQHLNKNS